MAALRRLLCALALAVPAGAAAQLLDRVVVVIGDEIITQSEFEQRARIVVQQLRRAQIPLPDEDEFLRQVLDAMVVGRLQLQYAQERGIGLDEGEVERQTEQLAQSNGLSVAEFERQVERSGIRYADFRSYLRERALVDQLQYIVSRQRVQVSDAEIESFLRLGEDLLERDARYRVRHILVAVPSQSAAGEIDAARARAERIRAQAAEGEPFAALAVRYSDGQNALEGGDLGWKTSAELPALAAGEIVQLEAGQSTGVIRSSSGFHLFQLEAKEGGGEVRVQQTRARHILLRPHALVGDEEARTQLSLLRDRAAGGETFDALARAHSDDTASAVDGGDLGGRSPGELDPVVENQMSRLKPGQVSAPFQTRFGWHIVMVDDRREVDSTEQTLRQRAINHIANSRVGDTMELWLRQLREQAYIQYLLPGADEPAS